MRSHGDLAYAFPDVEAATAFAGALRSIVRAFDEEELDDETDPASLGALLETTGSELRDINRSKRVVRLTFVLHDDGCAYADEAAYERGEESNTAEALDAALEALVGAHGGSEWRKGFEAIEASSPALAELRDAGLTAFAVLEAPPAFALNGLGEVSSTYGDRAQRMALLGAPPELSLVGRWRVRRAEDELGTWPGTLSKSTLSLDRGGDDPGWKAGDLLIFEAPSPAPSPATGLLARLKGLFGL